MKKCLMLPALCIISLTFLQGCSHVDTDEMETLLNKVPSIRSAVVEEGKGSSAEPRLVAYVITEPGRAPTEEEIRSYLKQNAHGMAIPSAFVMIDALLPVVHTEDIPPESRVPKQDPQAPSDPLQIQLVKLWESLLAGRSIGINDNFFELGGDQRTARSLFAEIEKVTGRSLPPSVIFEAPTIETLAGILENEKWTPRWQSLRPIQPEGDNRPLFFVHPMGGDVFGYVNLARRLGHNQPFYGLQAVGLEGKRPPIDRVEEMAALYLEEIRSVCPQGPYRLGGRCAIGGLIALEMSKQLLAQGQQVELLAMIDVRTAPRLKLSQEEMERRMSARRSSQKGDEGLLEKVFSATEDEQTRRLFEVKAANDWARDHYLPEVFPGRISFFISEKQWKAKPSSFFPDSPAGWQNLARDGLELQVVPGEHDTMLEEPFVETVAEALKARLAQALEEPHATP